MNKRQKKKLYKQEIGKNPPKKMKYSGKSYHRAINKPWGRKENDSKLLLGLREAERNCNTIHKSMGR